MLPLDLGYAFRDPGLLETALTHRSVGPGNNERLEYLGDAILDFVVAEALYLKFPTAPEGILTRLRASLVNRQALSGLARELNLGSHVILGPGEKKSGGWRRDSILANTLEAILGAIYLDGGLDACRAFILTLIAVPLAALSLSDPAKDPKTELQELLQAKREPLPVYEVVSEEGEAHDKLFRVRCTVAAFAREVIAEGRSKRNAEQAAARLILDAAGEPSR